MNILYLNLNILNERFGGRDKTKEQRGCISIVFSSKKSGWVRWRESNIKDISS